MKHGMSLVYAMSKCGRVTWPAVRDLDTAMENTILPQLDSAVLTTIMSLQDNFKELSNAMYVNPIRSSDWESDAIDFIGSDFTGSAFAIVSHGGHGSGGRVVVPR